MSFVFRGIPINTLAVADSMQAVWEASLKSAVRVYWVNAHAINISEKNPGYKQAVLQAEFVLNDGVGVLLAAKALGCTISENQTGTDWIPSFLDMLNTHHPGLSLYLLGAKPEVIKQAAQVFSERWPNIAIAGYNDGYFQDPRQAVEEIISLQPALLIVGMGMPLQEFFIDRHWDLLKHKVQIALAGGAIFDFLTLKIPRAPIWIRKIKLEWVYRLLQEPKRLAYRYLIGNPQFCWLICKEWITNRRKNYWHSRK